MPRVEQIFDWHDLHEEGDPRSDAADFRFRAGLGWASFVIAAAVIFARLIVLDVTEGPAYVQAAARPIEHRRRVAAPRGRILARDGSVLACDEALKSLEVHYRHLEDPPHPAWLRRQARERLSGPQRRDPAAMAAETLRIRQERGELHQRLAALCGLSPDEWTGRCRRIQTRVEAIRDKVNRQRLERAEASAAKQAAAKAERDARSDASLWQRIEWSVSDALFESEIDATPPPVTVSEELAHHPLLNCLPPEAVAEIEAHPECYPGVRIAPTSRRHYPGHSLAAHVVGHLGAADPKDNAEGRAVGRMGMEQACESILRGRPGELLEIADRGGRIERKSHSVEPRPGQDVVLTLDAALQQTAEALLDSAVARRASRAADSQDSHGGAILVLDVRTGEILASASAPRFDPHLFSAGDPDQLAALLAEEDHPLFDRVLKMAIPPGSVFKAISAIALLESGGIDPDEPYSCEGFLHSPDRLRCAIFRRAGVGHGPTTLSDALARSCNTYFFDAAGRLGPEPLVEWAERFGLGRKTGIELPGEAAGQVPSPTNIRARTGNAWRLADTQALAIGQGTLLVTPLQIARTMAAIANGGTLVTPHLVVTSTAPCDSLSLQPETLQRIRQGLTRVVADPEGTAHATVFCDSMEIAGKTGTAEVGPGHAEHAWFAGYAPADDPQVAFVVVLEHGGDGGEVAGPVARRLVQRLTQLGYLKRLRVASH